MTHTTDGQQTTCPAWHHWRYDQKTGRTHCREHERAVPQEEVDNPMGWNGQSTGVSDTQ